MGYICTRCGGTNVACEAIVNPNTGKIIDYFDGSFMHAICSNCENEVIISNIEEVKHEIDLRFHEFVERTGKEPEYVECQIVRKETGDEQRKTMKLSLNINDDDNDDVFCYCNGLYIIYKDGHAEPFTGHNSKDCVRYIGLKHRYMSFAISLTEHDSVQLLDDDSREESGSGTYYERECDALFDIDGRGNTERLVARNPKLRNLLEDGEYIPSLGQLNLMAHYMDELNKAFTYVSASPLSSTWYWSSTESSQAVAWYVVFSSGLTGTGNKYNSDRVRTVIDF